MNSSRDRNESADSFKASPRSLSEGFADVRLGKVLCNVKDNLRYRWIIFLLFVGCQLVLSIAGYGWGPLAPFLKKSMGVNKTQLGMVSSAFYFASALSAFPTGIIVDRYGVKRSLLSWLGLTGLPLLFLSFTGDNYYLFLVIVFLSGLGYGMGNPVASKGLFIWFDKRTRGTVFGIRQSAVSVGAGVAGLFLVYVAENRGPFVALRTVFWMIMGMMVIAFFAYQEPEGFREAVAGRGQEEVRLPRRGFRSILNNRALVTLFLIAGLWGLAQGVVSTFFLLYMNEGLGYPLLAASPLFAVVMISGAAGRAFWGVISDRLFGSSRNPVLMMIPLLALVSVTALAFWSNAWPQWLLIPVVIGVGLSSWGWHGITFLVVAEMTDSTSVATTVGLTTTFAWLGLSLGPIGFGTISDYFGYFYGWMALGVLCIFSFFLCLSLFRFRSTLSQMH